MRPPRRKTPIRELRTYRASRAVRLMDCDYTGAIDVHCTLCADRDTPFGNDTVAGLVQDWQDWPFTKVFGDV